MTKRMTIDEAVELIEKADLKTLGKMALARKKEMHPKGVTTFVVDRNINYTNICWVDCKFCAFYTHEKKEDAYILTFDEIDEKIDELVAIGGTQILFQGGVHPKLEIEWYEDLVEHIHNKYPQVTIHGFSAIEIDYIAQRSKLSISEVLARLKAKGLSSIPGAGAEILSDRVRDIIAPKKLDKDTWLEVHREAHKLGIKSTATMMYGTVETTREIVEHFDRYVSCRMKQAASEPLSCGVTRVTILSLRESCQRLQKQLQTSIFAIWQLHVCFWTIYPIFRVHGSPKVATSARWHCFLERMTLVRP